MVLHPADMDGTRSTPEASAPRVFTSGLRHSAYRALAGWRIRSGMFSKTGSLTNSRSLLFEGDYLETTSNSLLGSGMLEGFSRSMATLIKSTHNGNTSGIQTMIPILIKSKAPKP
jgi:hypothetical protein